MLRLLIGTGFLLMTVGFGAAGWQYWTSLPAVERAEAALAEAEALPKPSRQNWLISPAGGLVPQDEVRNFLDQDRFVPSRRVVVQRQVLLTDLLAEGEKLPEPAFLQVLADIRAPMVAEDLCPVLTRSIARDCAVHSARVVRDSVDPVLGTAQFRLELAYRLREPEAPLPDLAAHVLRSDILRLDLDPETQGTTEVPAVLQSAIDAVASACAGEETGEFCRPMQLSVDLVPGRPLSARAVIAWLAPLPKGMFVAPPL